MSSFPGTTATSAPWFRTYPRFALAVAGMMFLAVLVLRMQSADPNDAYSMMYVFPVALIAMASGARAGFAAGLASVALIVAWVVVRDVSLGPVAWIARAFPLLLLGVLVGDASDRLRRAEAERRRLEAAALIHREAVEINDSLVQGMVAAKWAFEAGHSEAGLQSLDETIGRAHELVSGLIRRAGLGAQSVRIGEPD